MIDQTTKEDQAILEDLRKLLERNGFICDVNPNWVLPNIAQYRIVYALYVRKLFGCYYIYDCSICFFRTQCIKIASLADPQYRDKFLDWVNNVV